MQSVIKFADMKVHQLYCKQIGYSTT